MTLKQRYTLAYDTDTRGIVTTAMIDQARKAIDTAGIADAVKSLALDVIRNPNAYAQQVTLMAVNDSVIGPKIDANQGLTDAEIGTAVGKALLVLGWKPAAV